MRDDRTTGKQIAIRKEDRVFVLTGAGVSAESGIPTFRDNGGLWHGYRVEEVATPEAWEEDAARVWNFYSMRRKDARRAQPNPAHATLAALEDQIGDRFFLCTQNVDDLHERAGSRRLLHMHGELFRSRCEYHRHGMPPSGFDCEREPFADEALYETESTIAHCECGGRIRPHIVWFGEIPLEMDRISREIDRCTVMLVVGTSGNVYPAANFVHWAAQRNAIRPGSVRTCYVGPEEPLNAAAFTQVVLGKAGEVLPQLFRVDE
jgi:NAD-dependent deacetylase